MILRYRDVAHDPLPCPLVSERDAEQYKSDAQSGPQVRSFEQSSARSGRRPNHPRPDRTRSIHVRAPPTSQTGAAIKRLGEAHECRLHDDTEAPVSHSLKCVHLVVKKRPQAREKLDLG